MEIYSKPYKIRYHLCLYSDGFIINEIEYYDIREVELSLNSNMEDAKQIISMILSLTISQFEGLYLSKRLFKRYKKRLISSKINAKLRPCFFKDERLEEIYRMSQIYG